MEKIVVETTKKREVADITDQINRLLEKKGMEEGICHLFVTHTTAALTTADLDPDTDLDMLDAFSKIIPDLSYRHPHDPSHVGDHIMSSIIGSSVSLPFDNLELILGTWQRVVLIEFNGPRRREIIVSILTGESRE